MLKRYRGLAPKETLKKQSDDLRTGKVKAVTFWIEKDRWDKVINDPARNYDFSKFSIKEADNNLVSLHKLYPTKKLNKVNETAYLHYKDFDAYNLAKYITVNEEIVYGTPISNLVKGHKLYAKWKQEIEALEKKDMEEKKRKKENLDEFEA